jgi:molybdopterin/thiamine biosynthesis adenylyltransferase
MTKQERIDKYLRQSEIINIDKLVKSSVTIIGVGSVGSFTALMLAKMGVGKITAYDEDGVEEHNLPGQFFDIEALKQFKTDALNDLLYMFTPEVKYKGYNKFYKNQKLAETVIVATDNMEKSRWLVWEQFLKQPQCKYLIDARMGAELAKVYTITSKSQVVQKFYKGTLHTDAESTQLPCTARTIIYNVLMVSSLIGRAYKGIIQNEKFPKELIFNMTQITPYSLMLRDK